MTLDSPLQFEREAVSPALGEFRLRRRSREWSSWPLVLSLLMLAGCLLGTSDFGSQIAARVGQGVLSVLRRPVIIGPVRPEVVLVSLQESDRRGVVLTVEPRGYHVEVARTAGEGLNQLAARSGRVGMVVVDGALANAAEVARQALAICPRARLVILRGSRRPDQVAARVLHQL